MKLLNMLLIAAMLTIVGIAEVKQLDAAPATITAYSVTNIQMTTATYFGITSYTATVSTTKNPKTKNFTNGDLITISAVSCTYVPDKAGENGIVVVNGAATTLLFSTGGTCAVKNIALTTESSSKKQ